MDSFFKAAVCDLDKLLDDFELNTDELDCKPVSLTPPAYPFSLLGSQSFALETPTVPQTLPDLNSLHYGSAPSCPGPPASHHSSSVDGELKGQPLTGVDLLSSVDRRPPQTSTPPCPDRALKPVCDLVSDTSSAILVRANSHDAFSELDAAEKQLEEEGALLVDFDSPLVVLGEESGGLALGADCGDTEGKRPHVAESGLLGLDPSDPVDGYSASLSLLDVILPAAVGCGSGEDTVLQKITTPDDGEDEEVACMDQPLDNSFDFSEPVHVLPCEKEELLVAANEQKTTQEPSVLVETESPKSLNSESEPVGLSCLPIAVSMCGALVKPKQATDDSLQGLGEDDQTERPESTESDSASEAIEDKSHQVESSDISVIDNNIPSASSVDSSLVAVNPSICGEVTDVSASHWEDRVSPEEQRESDVNLFFETTPSNDPEPSSVDPEFGFEYLSESNQAELVTDEELDAFLQSQTETEHGEGASYCNRFGDWGQDEGFSELNGDLEDRLAEEELSRCGRGRWEQLEGPASAESSRTVCVSTEGSSNLSSCASTRESPKSSQLEAELEAASVNYSSTSSPTQPQPIGSPDPQHCYGGARPKQLHCQASPPPPTAEAGEEQEPMPIGLSAASCAVEEEENSSPSPSSPNPADQPHNGGEPQLTYSPQEPCESSVCYDELSEPPPYPGEPSRSEDEKREQVEGLGSKQPDWVPDAAAPNCMNCWQKFTFTKRRHHCRACGKVYCAVCCSRKCKLKYLDKEARVCVTCFNTIHRAQAREHMMSPTGPSPNPNIPSEYCSTIPPLQQARAAGTLNSPPPTVMVPVSVLKQPSSDGCPREQKRVWFADGILPNGEVADTSRLSVSGRKSSQESSPVTPEPPTAGPGSSEGGSGGGGSSASEAPGSVEMARPLVTGPWDYALLCGVGASVQRSPSLLPEDEDGLPPLLITTGEDEAGGDVLFEERPAPCQIMLLLEEGGPRPLTFVLNANLLVNVKLVTYGGRRCWCFSSSGLQALGQRELLFVLECLPEERALPKDLFTLYLNIYQDAQKGKFLENLGNVTFTSSFLGSKEHGGMLFFQPSCQPLEGLATPPQPFLCGLLIQRLEVPWAKVFPLRLLLRLGADKNVYPTTLVSVRFRESMYRETGHTIMNLLADLRNYQYSLPSVEGLRIHMEMGHSYIDIPKSSFNEMLKVVNASNEHVISVGASFSLEADSHLVCFQNEEGNYQTQASSKPGQTRTVTGASFVVFNGALKASSGFIAKSSIVEDGLMVQIPPDTMEALRTALREQTDFHIPCGRNDGGELRENVTIRWVDWAVPVNAGVTSAIDGRPLDGVHSVRMQQDTEFESEGRTIRCTEVFYQLKEADSSVVSVLATCGVFQREMALAACGALAPHLAVLTSAGINSLSLRVSTQADMVEYQAGSGGRLLPQRYMNELDSALIPVIHGDSASVPQTTMDMEFLFYITRII